MIELKNVGIEVIFGSKLWPISVEHFSYIKNDPELKRIAENASMYFILQKPCLVFRYLNLSKDEISGEIYQVKTNHVAKFSMPLYQTDLVEGFQRDLGFKFELNKYTGKTKYFTEEGIELSTLDNVEYFTIAEANGEQLNFINPETILERFFRGVWKVEITGSLDELVRYEVKYIGHSVKQFIADRLTKHSNLQRMLTQMESYEPGMPIAKELCILLLEIRDIFDVKMASNLDEQEWAEYITGPSKSRQEAIYYDAEKAFIRYFDNDWLVNREKYPNYPKGKDGLFEENYPAIMYSLDDRLDLFTYSKTLRCGQLERESILVDRELKTVTKVPSLRKFGKSEEK